MPIEYQNFDWNETERKLVLFIPNYKRKKYLNASLRYHNTKASTDDWLIVIGNDGIHENFNEFKNSNVRYFTLSRENPEHPRNGGFIRNFFIKNCKSDWIFQRDPEIIIQSDYISTLLEHQKSNRSIRCGRRCMLPEIVSRKLLESYSGTIEAKDVAIDTNRPTFMHYGMCLPTALLQNIRGYDEDFTLYGYEDTDLFRRLVKLGLKLVADQSIVSLHIHHPREDTNNDWTKMEKIYNAKENDEPVRNTEDWGNG